MIGEVFGAVWHEVSHEPVVFAAEVAQFVLLLLIVKAIVFGFGSRQGFVTNMLRERRRRLEDLLQAVEHREREFEEAPGCAEACLNEAEAECAAMLESARREGAEILASGRAEAEEEVRRIGERAQEILERERAELLERLHAEFPGLVTAAARGVVRESMSAAEQRGFLREAILDSLGDLQSIQQR